MVTCEENTCLKKILEWIICTYMAVIYVSEMRLIDAVLC